VKVYSVEVHTDLIMPGSHSRITRYLVFNDYTGAADCARTLMGKENKYNTPEDYFEAAKISRDPVGEVINRDSIQSDFVLTYLQKTFN
jgi:hypothetical protein